MVEAYTKTLQALSPRYTRPVTPAWSLFIHGSVALLWGLLFFYAFFGHGASAWSIGIVYVVYDTLLILFTFVETYRLRRPQNVEPQRGPRPSLTVIIAAFNEASVLPQTIAALRQQSEPPDAIIIADDGSTDGTGELLKNDFHLAAPGLNEISLPAPLRWLRAEHMGKAAVLNRVLPHIDTDLIVTVDADTSLETGALAGMREGFHRQPGLVAATGVLTPSCTKDMEGRFFEWFQTYEYIRNFLGRYAWAQMDSLLLISGAFAGFRTDAVIKVGGFDADCIVEDYELIHRLRRYGYDHGLKWHSAVLGNARAHTSAPSTILGFLRQRRRWFGGFLQTQFWYRDMVGAKKYHRLGMMMLPVKAVDTFQPIYGLCAFAILLWYVVSGKFALVLIVLEIIFAKIIIDLAFHLWSLKIYKRWVGEVAKASFFMAILASFIEPFSFQLFRHVGACWGWIAVLSGKRIWGVQIRLPAPVTSK